MNSKTKKSFSDKAKFIYLSLFLVSLFLLTISHFLKEYPLFEALTLELGIAGIIALILIFTVERLTKEEREKATKGQTQEIAVNLFNAIFKRYIPDSVFTEVERCLFSNDVVRTGHTIYYHISAVNNIDGFPEKDKQSHLQCDITSQYELKNITDKDIEYTVKPHIELTIDERLQGFVKFTSFSIDSIDKDVTCAKNTGTHMILNKTIKIAAKGKVSITTKSVTIRRKIDSEIWASKIPSEGMKIIIASSPSIKVEASANHSTELVHDTISKNNDLITQSWSINSGIFPHQSIIFWWKDSKIQ